MAELAVLGALIEGLDDDGLLAGVAAGEDQDDLTRLDEFTHSYCGEEGV